MSAQQPALAATGGRTAVDFRAAFDRAPTPLAVFRATVSEIVLVAANLAALSELGLDAAGIGERRLGDIVPAQPKLVLEGAIRRASQLGQPSQATLDWLGGPSVRHDVFVTAIDERTPSELVLLAFQARTAQTKASTLMLDHLGALGDGQIFVFDIQRGRVRYLATELAEMIGHSMESPLDLERVRSVIHPDDFEAVAAYFSDLGLMGGPTSSSVGMRLARPEGGWRWTEARGRALTLDREGRARTVLGVVVDITERRAMSRALDRAARAVLRAGEQERRRVARNLHDSTAQHLVAIDLSLSALARRMPANPDTSAIMRDMREAVAAAHREVRTYSYLLHPPQLQRLGLEATLRRLVEGFGRRSELAIELSRRAPRRASSDIELALFRAAQEAISERSSARPGNPRHRAPAAISQRRGARDRRRRRGPARGPRVRCCQRRGRRYTWDAGEDGATGGQAASWIPATSQD